MMETLHKWLISAGCAVLAYFQPILSLILCVGIFIGIDFITGVWASYKRAKAAKTEWGFKSDKMWNTIYKFCFASGGIWLSFMIDTNIVPHMNLHLTNLFTGFICGVELFSYLENAADISSHPIFLWLKKYVIKVTHDKTGIDVEEIQKETKRTNRKAAK